MPRSTVDIAGQYLASQAHSAPSNEVPIRARTKSLCRHSVQSDSCTGSTAWSKSYGLAYQLSVVAGAADDAHNCAHAVRRPEGTYLLEVRFHPGALPARVHEYFRADLYVDRHVLTELPLNVHYAVYVAAGMTSGALGIKREWPD